MADKLTMIGENMSQASPPRFIGQEQADRVIADMMREKDVVEASTDWHAVALRLAGALRAIWDEPGYGDDSETTAMLHNMAYEALMAEGMERSGPTDALTAEGM